MTENKSWKKIVSGMMALTLVAGAVPANVGGFLSGNSAIVASADDVDDIPQEIEDPQDPENPQDPETNNWEVVKWHWIDDDVRDFEVLAILRNKETEARDSIAADVTKVETKATCEKDGYITYTATVVYEGETFTDTRTVDTEPATGHKWGTATYDWVEDPTTGSMTCTAKRICENDENHVETENAKVEYEEIKTPTVREPGEGVYTATFSENENFETQTKKVTIDSLEPVYGEPTYEWSEDNSTVTAILPCINGDEDDAFKVTVNTIGQQTKEPNCTDKGETTYTATFDDDRFETQTKVVADVEATGHTYGAPEWQWDEVKRTATAVFYCEENDDQQDIQANVTREVVKEPTCTEPGKYIFHASVDFDGETYTADKEIDVPATGHNWKITWIWDGLDSAVAYAKCEDHEETLYEANLAEIKITEEKATCTKPGLITYTAVATIDGKEVTDVKTVETSMAEHVYGDVSYVWEEIDGGYKVTATRKCVNCEDEVQTEEATVEYNVTVEPTVKEKGEGVYTATFTNEAFETKTKTVELNTINPDYGEQTAVWSEDFSEVTVTRPCINGSVEDAITETAKTTSKVTKEASCTSMGITTYTAEFENENLAKVEKEVANIPMTEHVYGVPSWDWTPTEDGYAATMHKTCTECGKDETFEADVTSVYADGVTTFTAVATVDGVTYTAVMKLNDVQNNAPEISYEKGDGCVKLIWTTVKGADKYGIAGYVNGNWKLLDQGFGTSYVLNDLKAGTNYKVAIIAMIDGEWNMDFSNAITVTPNESKTPEISFEKGDSSVKLTWTEVSGADKYAVVGYVDGEWTKLGEGFGTSYVVKNLKAGTNYKVAVIARIDGKWNEDYSNAVTVTPNAAVDPYPTVETRVKDNKIGFKWSAVPGAQKYAIAVFQANKWVVKKQLDGSITTWTSPQVANGTYKVAVVAKINGQWVTAQAPAHAFDVTVK